MSTENDENIIQGIFKDSPSWHPADDAAAANVEEQVDLDSDDFASTDADEIMNQKEDRKVSHDARGTEHSAAAEHMGPVAHDVVFAPLDTTAQPAADANAPVSGQVAVPGSDFAPVAVPASGYAAGYMPLSRAMIDKGAIPGGAAHDAQKRHRGRNALLITLGSVLGVILAVYIVGVFFFLSHMGFDTKVEYDGVTYDYSLMSVSQIQEQQSELVSGYKLAIDERGLSTEYIDASDIDLVYAPDSQLNDILDSQNPFMFFMRIYNKLFTMGNSAYNLEPSVTFDAGKLEKIVTSLSCMEASNQTDPVDAKAVYDTTQAKYVIQPEQLGTKIVEDAAQEAVSEAISGGQTVLDLGTTDAYKAPSITTSTQSLVDKIDLFNQYLRFSITYQAGSKTPVVLDATTAESWLVYNADGSVSLDQDKVKSWVETVLAPAFDTVNTTRTFVGGDGGTYTLSGGTYGWMVDQDSEVDAINTAFANQTGDTREPIWLQSAVSFDGNDFGNTFLECNITTQTMYVVQDGAVIFSAPVVTGSPDGVHDTPTGVWSILDKKSPYVMHGDQHEDGSYEYTSPCTYWMRVTWTGVGFHDATWQPWFGGDRYTYAGSHGCINMSLGEAGSLWSLCYIDEPVLIHF